MHPKSIFLGALVFVSLLTACTPQDEKAIAAASIDAACANVPQMDAQWTTLAPRANREAQLAYNSIKVSLVAYCNGRPYKDPQSKAAAITSAAIQLATLIATYTQH